MNTGANRSTEEMAAIKMRLGASTLLPNKYAADDAMAILKHIRRLETENEALRNLANNLQPGPISAALGGAEHEKPFRLAAGFAPEPAAQQWHISHTNPAPDELVLVCHEDGQREVTRGRYVASNPSMYPRWLPLPKPYSPETKRGDE